MCEKFMTEIERRLNVEDIFLENNPESSNIAIAFAVFNSRLQADIERDLRKGDSYSNIENFPNIEGLRKGASSESLSQYSPHAWNSSSKTDLSFR